MNISTRFGAIQHAIGTPRQIESLSAPKPDAPALGIDLTLDHSGENGTMEQFRLDGADASEIAKRMTGEEIPTDVLTWTNRQVTTDKTKLATITAWLSKLEESSQGLTLKIPEIPGKLPLYYAMVITYCLEHLEMGVDAENNPLHEIHLLHRKPRKKASAPQHHA